MSDLVLQWTCGCDGHGWRRKPPNTHFPEIAFSHLMTGFIRVRCLTPVLSIPLCIIDMCSSFVGVSKDARLNLFVMMQRDSIMEKLLYGPNGKIKKDQSEFMIEWNDSYYNPENQLKHFFTTNCYSTHVLSQKTPLKIMSFLMNKVTREKFIDLIDKNKIYDSHRISPIIHCVNQIQSTLMATTSQNDQYAFVVADIWISVIKVLLWHRVDSFMRCIYCNENQNKYEQYHKCTRSGTELHWNALKLLLLAIKDIESTKYDTHSQQMQCIDKLCNVLSVATSYDKSDSPHYYGNYTPSPFPLTRIEIRKLIGSNGIDNNKYYVKFHKVLSYIPSFETLYKLLSVPNCIPFGFLCSFASRTHPRQYRELHTIDAHCGYGDVDDSDTNNNENKEIIMDAIQEKYAKYKGKVVIPLHWKVMLLFTHKRVIMDVLSLCLPDFNNDILSVINCYISDEAYLEGKNKHINVYNRTMIQLDYICFDKPNILESWKNAMSQQLIECAVKKTQDLNRKMTSLLNKMAIDNYDVISKQTLEMVRYLVEKKRLVGDDDNGGEWRDKILRILRSIVAFGTKQPFFAHNFAILLRDIDVYLKSVSYNGHKVDKFVLELLTTSVRFDLNKFHFFGAMEMIAELYNCDMFNSEYVNEIMMKQINWESDRNVEGVIKCFMKLEENKRDSMGDVRQKLNSVKTNFNLRIKYLIALIP